MKNILDFLLKTKILLRITLEVLFLLSLTALVLFLLLGENAGPIPVQIANNFQLLSNILGSNGLTAILTAAVFYIILNRFIKQNNE